MEVINLLLQAPSKGAIEQALNIVFLSRNEPLLTLFPKNAGDENIGLTKTLRVLLGLPVEDVSDAQIAELRGALLDCIQAPLSSGNLEDLAEFFQLDGQQINPKLKQLLGQVSYPLHMLATPYDEHWQTIGSRLEAWKEGSALGRVSLPRLQDFNWSLQFQRASSEVAEMQIPSVIMSLNIESTPCFTGDMSKVETVDVEMSREALETMIDGLGKIRDQLNNMK